MLRCDKHLGKENARQSTGQIDQRSAFTTEVAVRGLLAVMMSLTLFILDMGDGMRQHALLADDESHRQQ